MKHYSKNCFCNSVLKTPFPTINRQPSKRLILNCQPSKVPSSPIETPIRERREFNKANKFCFVNNYQCYQPTGMHLHEHFKAISTLYIQSQLRLISYSYKLNLDFFHISVCHSHFLKYIKKRRNPQHGIIYQGFLKYKA